MKITPIKLAVAMVIGIILTIVFGNIICCIILGIGILTGIVQSFIKHRTDLSLAILSMALTFSSLLYSYSISPRTHPSINYITRYVTLTGEIITPAEENPYSDNYRYNLRLSSIENRTGIADTKETILLTTPTEIPCGSVVTVRGIIDSLPEPLNETDFDTAKHYKSCNIFTRIYSEDITISDNPATIYSLGGRICEAIDKLIYKYYYGNGAAILSAILTGSTHHFSAEYSDILQYTGLTRIFHPAYLHIFVILGFLGLFRYFIRRQIRDVLTIVLFIAYAMLQSGSIGFSRCLLCVVVASIYRIAYGSAYFPDTMATVIITAIIVSPTVIFNTAFILSITGGMLVWAFVPPVAAKLRHVTSRLRRPIAVALVCMLVYTPLATYYFSDLCIYSPIISVISAPLVICAMLSAPCAIIMTETLGISPVLSGFSDLSVNALYRLPYEVCKLPFSNINIAKPTDTVMLLFVSVIFALFYFLRKRQLKLILSLSTSVGLFASVIISTVAGLNTAEFTFVNVGQGDGAIVHTPYRETIVIDGGGGNGWSEYNPGKLLFVPYLEAKGYNHIELAIVTHYHQDHIEGIINMLSSIRTDMVIVPEIRDHYSGSMLEWHDELVRVARLHNTEVVYVSEDMRITFADGIIIDIFSPAPLVGKLDENDTSMPIKVHYGDFSVMYTGDMTKHGEYSLMNTADVSADILKVAHHGSRDSSCAEFIEAVDPSASVISCGIGNIYSHPHIETLQRLSHTQILRTDKTMDISIFAKKNGSYRIEE